MRTKLGSSGRPDLTEGVRPDLSNLNNLSDLNNLNDLNRSPDRRPPPPDLLENVLPNQKSPISNGSPAIRQRQQRNRADLPYQCGCNACRNPKKPRSRFQRRMIRAFCCFGWMFCCPVFTLGWALRTAPVDKQDLQEDDCYPCFAPPK